MGKKVLNRMPKVYKRDRNYLNAAKTNQGPASSKDLDALRGVPYREYPLRAMKLFIEKCKDKPSIAILKNIAKLKDTQSVYNALVAILSEKVEFPEIALTSYLYKCSEEIENTPPMLAMIHAYDLLNQMELNSLDSISKAILIVLCVIRMLDMMYDPKLLLLLDKIAKVQSTNKYNEVAEPFRDIIAEYSHSMDPNINTILSTMLQNVVPKSKSEISMLKSMKQSLNIAEQQEVSLKPISMLQPKIIEFKTFEPRITNSVEMKIKKDKEKRRMRKQRQQDKIKAFSSSTAMLHRNEVLSKANVNKKKYEMSKTHKILEELETEYRKEKTSAHNKKKK
jgi:hypothetical protein